MFGQSQSQQAVLEWSLPVVHDCLREYYVQHFPLKSCAFLEITDIHFAVWTLLVHGDYEAARAEAALLAQKAQALNFDFAGCGAADRYIAAELLDLSLRRFRRMPQEGKTNNKTLLTILLHLSRQTSPAVAVSPLRRAA